MSPTNLNFFWRKKRNKKRYKKIGENKKKATSPGVLIFTTISLSLFLLGFFSKKKKKNTTLQPASLFLYLLYIYIYIKDRVLYI
jgi:hypothetical protein